MIRFVKSNWITIDILKFIFWYAVCSRSLGPFYKAIYYMRLLGHIVCDISLWKILVVILGLLNAEKQNFQNSLSFTYSKASSSSREWLNSRSLWYYIVLQIFTQPRFPPSNKTLISLAALVGEHFFQFSSRSELPLENLHSEHFQAMITFDRGAPRKSLQIHNMDVWIIW